MMPPAIGRRTGEGPIITLESEISTVTCEVDGLAAQSLVSETECRTSR